MKYVVEPGDFDLMIGASAEDIKLTDTIAIFRRKICSYFCFFENKIICLSTIIY